MFTKTWLSALVLGFAVLFGVAAAGGLLPRSLQRADVTAIELMPPGGLFPVAPVEAPGDDEVDDVDDPGAVGGSREPGDTRDDSLNGAASRDDDDAGDRDDDGGGDRAGDGSSDSGGDDDGDDDDDADDDADDADGDADDDD